MSSISAKDKVVSGRGTFVSYQPQVPKEKNKIVKHIVSAFSNFPQKFPKKLPEKNVRIMAGIVIGVVGISAGGFYEYEQSQNPVAIYQRKLHTLTQDVSKYINLPTNETPVIATVSDITALPHESFFANAQNGDKILMYKQNRLAVLYRQSTNQVITYATLKFQDSAPNAVPVQVSVIGASTSAVTSQTASAAATTTQSSTSSAQYIPQGKILIAPQN